MFGVVTSQLINVGVSGEVIDFSRDLEIFQFFCWSQSFYSPCFCLFLPTTPHPFLWIFFSKYSETSIKGSPNTANTL